MFLRPLGVLFGLLGALLGAPGSLLGRSWGDLGRPRGLGSAGGRRRIAHGTAPLETFFESFFEITTRRGGLRFLLQGRKKMGAEEPEGDG